MVDGSTPEETMDILENLKSRYEDHHKVSYSYESLEACVSLAGRYVNDREFPDKAIDVMDEVGARHKSTLNFLKLLRNLERKLLNIKEKKIQVVKSQRYEEAAQLRDLKRKRFSINLSMKKISSSR